MDTPSSSTRDLARRLLAVEAGSMSTTDARVHEAVRACEKLRLSLTRFAGPDGFTALMRRALVLASAEVPTLRGLSLKSDSSMEELATLVVDETNGGSDAAVAIIANLLELLITFIGAPLTMRLVGEVWPDAVSDK